MLNTSSPSPLFDEENESTSYDNAKKKKYIYDKYEQSFIPTYFK